MNVLCKVLEQIIKGLNAAITKNGQKKPFLA